MSEWKKVDKEEFEQFLIDFPKSRLEWDCTGICEPPLGSYNDFSDGKVWPESMVAKIVMDEPREYYLQQ